MKNGLSSDIVTLACGSGGASSTEFINKVFMPILGDIMPFSNEDSGIFSLDSIESKKGVTSTDSYIVHPLFFKGGDIGKLSICGSSNDVAMMGGKGRFINIGFIIEEGFDINTLKKIIESIRKECDNLNLKILSADTKVLPSFSQNKDDKNLFINTTCIGDLQKEGISAKNLQHNDAIILSGKIGSHGSRIFLEQNNMKIDGEISSDCASLYPMLEPIFRSDFSVHALRDATRGGLAAVLNEWAIASSCYIEINESAVGVEDSVLGVCEMLGLEPFDLANEGVCVMAVKRDIADEILQILRQYKLGQNAEIIGHVRKDFNTEKDSNREKKKNLLDRIYFQKVILNTKYGTKRFLDHPQGELLPRIC